jgi:hypothetical protein
LKQEGANRQGHHQPSDHQNEDDQYDQTERQPAAQRLSASLPRMRLRRRSAHSSPEASDRRT